ncbi:MAG: zinc ribbon domain-containing protein [Oscillospiraceae bacterium]|nr:zinc ribbon domain-containing protein [Oscillospiraceae bacterium]
MTCRKCGSHIPEGNLFCSGCGEACQNKSENSSTRPDYLGADYTSSFAHNDIEDNKIFALFSYIGFLFIVPLIAAPQSGYAKFHANQGIIVFILSVATSVINTLFIFARHIVFVPFTIVFSLLGVALLGAIAYGIVNAVTGKAVEIPIIGKFRILT